MQRRALKELNRYRAIGTSRALVVAAAGSGKTYLAAFDALNFNPKRLLYIVHEGSILRKSLETFQDVFGSSVTCGIYSGTSKESDADFVFATNITMCKSLELFARDEFDYIIIDECHHAAAETYKRIIAYFEPEFLLGLTATPERMFERLQRVVLIHSAFTSVCFSRRPSLIILAKNSFWFQKLQYFYDTLSQR